MIMKSASGQLMIRKKLIDCPSIQIIR